MQGMLGKKMIRIGVVPPWMRGLNRRCKECSCEKTEELMKPEEEENKQKRVEGILSLKT